MNPIINQITSPIQCTDCKKESEQNAYELRSQLVVGYTSKGFQAWCTKHKVTVVYFTPDDLAGMVNQIWEAYS